MNAIHIARYPFKFEIIGEEKNGIAATGSHFRISDSLDNAICFCHLREHAELVVEALNKTEASA